MVRKIAEVNMSQQVSLKNIDETRNCFSEEVNQNEMIRRKHKPIFKTYIILNTYLF